MRLAGILEAIREEHLDGWLFYNFKHRDPLSDSILDISADRINTRAWYYFIAPHAEPVKIVHGIESTILDDLPGVKRTYQSQKELRECLDFMAGKTVAAQFSTELPIISFLDHGTALFLSKIGIRIISSAGLLQRMLSLLDDNGIETHEEAACHLYETVRKVWKRLSSRFTIDVITEADVQGWILGEFEQRGLVTDHDPIVAAGKNSANPHYSPNGPGKKISKGDVVQLDMWAKKPNGIYADISWIGVLCSIPTREQENVFRTLAEARDRAASFIDARHKGEKPIQGRDVDFAVREVIETAGYGEFIRHRTGHSIDSECHGSGVNLDGVEFPDTRYLLDGSCFSVEPGIYLEEYGMRTEIDIYMCGGKPVISGGEPQSELLTIGK